MDERATRAVGAALAVAVVSTVLVLLTAVAPGWAAAAGPTTAAEAPSAGVPVATIGEFDCARLVVAVTLDNTRSTRRVTFGYGASFGRPLHKPYSGADGPARVEVAAGRTKDIALPVRDDARTVVTVTLPDGGSIHSAGVCGVAPGAAFGLDDCDALGTVLTLDNGSSGSPTRYRWSLVDPAGPLRSGTVDVPGGQVVDAEVPLLEGSPSRVEVSVDGRGLVGTSDWRSCGKVVLDPRASFGRVDCTDVSVPIFLDNSRATARSRFRLPAHEDVVLRSGETRALRLRLPLAERLAVTSGEEPADARPLDLAVVSTARCAEAPARPTATVTLAARDGNTGTATHRSAGAGEVDRATGSAPRLPLVGLGALLLVTGGVLLTMWRRRRRGTR